MKDAHGLEIGGGIANAGSNQVSFGQKNDVDEMQAKLNQLKHLWVLSQ